MPNNPAEADTWAVMPSTPVPDEVTRLLTTVPEWFGDPASNAEYIEDARAKETWIVRSASGAVIAVALLTTHFPQTLEIHFMVVDRKYHGMGVGSAVIKAIENEAQKRGARLLEVKTLGASHSDQNYARTRHFYKKVGFIPLEETDLWGKDTPCLIMVKPI
jgi:GNAT superfamily N-acetyltransferase